MVWWYILILCDWCEDEREREACRESIKLNETEKLHACLDFFVFQHFSAFFFIGTIYLMQRTSYDANSSFMLNF